MRILTGLLSLFIALFSLVSPVWAGDMKATKDETVILITIDGFRWQEVFRGVDKAFFDQKDYNAYHNTHDAFKKAFWRGDTQKRRAALLPFFWDTIAQEGQLYGNRDKGSAVSITNSHHFSYPGYSEILTGYADDKRIASNDKIPNPNRTVLEWLNNMPENKGKVAAFGSWDVFPYIINEARSGVPVNAGFETYSGAPGNDRVAFLNDLQKQVPSPWDSVRFDAFTMGFARAALADKKMRTVYIALGETDDFAHAGFYDQYILAAHRNDKAIADLWAWLQNDPRYKDKTTLIITTDHGRGNTSLEAWKNHGRFTYTKEDGTKAVSNFAGDDQTWVAAIGPSVPALGEIKGGAPVTSTQIAATIGSILGYTYESGTPTFKAGDPINQLLKK